MSSFFNIDFKDFANKVNNYLFRQPLFTAMLDSWMQAMNQVNAELVILRDALGFKLRFNAQIIYLTEYLNQIYDPSLKRIFITNTADIVFTYWYNKIELQTPVYLSNDAEGAAPYYIDNLSELASSIDYIINIPAAVTFDADKVRSQVNQYNVAPKIYTIQTF